MRTFILGFSFLILLQSAVKSQPLCTLTKYSISDGYVDDVVNDIQQDRNGLIWIGSRDGLIQFDGYTFRNKKSYPGDGINLDINDIGTINQNSQGDIWCKNQNGRAFLYQTTTNQFFDVLKSVETDGKRTDPIVDIIPLRKGITWLICRSGICYRLKDSECLAGKGIELLNFSGRKVFRIFQDSDGDEWIITDKGITIIGEKKLLDTTCYLHLSEIEKIIWLSDGNKKFGRYNPKTSQVELIILPFKYGNILRLQSMKNDILAILTSKAGLLLYNEIDSTFRQINVNCSPQVPNAVTSVYEDSQGDLWMSNRHAGIIHYNKITGNVSILQAPINHKIRYDRPNKYMVHEDQYGTVWTIPVGGNLCYFDRTDQSLKYYFANPLDSNSIISPLIRKYFFDSQGNFWFDDNQTLGKISFFNRNFKIISTIENNAETRSLLLDKNKNLWVGTKNKELQILNPQNESIGYLNEQGTLSKKPVPFDGSIYCFMEDKLGSIWIGTRMNGLFRFQRKNGTEYSFKVTHFKNDPNDSTSLSNNNIYSIIQDDNGLIWIGTYGGGLNLFTENPQKGSQFLNYRNQMPQYPIGTSFNVRCIHSANSNVIMVGTTEGLISFNPNFRKPEEIRFFRNTTKADDDSSLFSNDIFYVFTDKNKNTFVLSRSGGISQISSGDLLSESIRFSSFTKKDGLLSDQSLSMIEDKKGLLWLVSKQTISKFYPGQRMVEHCSNFIFHQNIIFSEAKPTINARGNLVIGTNKGILEVFSELESKQKKFPEIVITGLTIQGEKVDASARNLNPITLKPGQRNLSIQFAVLDYRDPLKILYAYKMEGIDTDWNYSGRERSATYINLPHGHYRFIVKSTNSEGIWIENIKAFTIEVEPKFKETIWAWLLYIVIIIVVIQILAYVLFTIFKLKHEVKSEQKLTNLKLKFFTEVSHELRTPLTLITSPVSDILENESLTDPVRESLSIVKNNSDRMLRMVNQILDFLKIQHHKMKLWIEETEIISFTSKVMNYFSLIALEKNIQFSLETPYDKLYIWIDQDKFEKILFNLLSNAFKYTPEGKIIRVQIHQEEDHVILSVEDEGIGILSKKFDIIFERFETLISKDLLQESSGIGLSLVKELVELHHGTLEVFSQPNMGSQFKITLKTDNQHFANDPSVDFILSDEVHSTIPFLSKDNCNEPGRQNGSDSGRKSMIIIEDNFELRSYLKKVLSRDYTVTEASNGKDGLEKIRMMLPDFIISDIMMPVMDGLEMIKKIKDDRELCHIPIILLSARDALTDKIIGLENGIDDYITKPFVVSYLKSRIDNIIKQRKMLQSLYLESFSKHETKTVKEKLNPSLPPIAPFDSQFIEKLMAYMEKNIDNPNLSVDDLVCEMATSRTLFFRKIKSLLGLTPVDFIRTVRIKRAIQLFDSGITSVASIAYSCGFSDPNYFAKCFKKETGISPSKYNKKDGL